MFPRHSGVDGERKHGDGQTGPAGEDIRAGLGVAGTGNRAILILVPGSAAAKPCCTSGGTCVVMANDWPARRSRFPRLSGGRRQCFLGACSGPTAVVPANSGVGLWCRAAEGPQGLHNEQIPCMGPSWRANRESRPARNVLPRTQSSGRPNLGRRGAFNASERQSTDHVRREGLRPTWNLGLKVTSHKRIDLFDRTKSLLDRVVDPRAVPGDVCPCSPYVFCHVLVSRSGFAWLSNCRCCPASS
ncbi:hypothetical protein B0T24DRAFT_3828 [Lasiosphaeria ovina]|uniref:Uncharacterized protein n=1 Tax=Lasiosphaeria ovina TaxID=92902 RepID=A0AAE0NIN5_9PEZI|nr:hypothetical protein B0T24DRAFT_3828 [Lasiosphaeria ovina]